MAKLILAPVSADVVKAAANSTVKAVVSCEGAKVRLMSAVAEAVATIGQPLTAKQYDRQFKPSLDAGFARAEKAGKVKEGTGRQYASKLKTAVLALLCGAASPIAGETFWEFYSRAAPLVANAKLANGAPVWEATKKAGRKVGHKVPKKTGGGAMPGAVHLANVEGSKGDSDDQEGGFNRSPAIAAALILTKGNEARAQRLVTVLQTYTPEFDKWAATILTDADKAEIGERSKPASPEASNVTIIPPVTSEPETAIAAAMVKAAAPKNAKARKVA
jgi:hypothetical protein